MVFPFLFLRLTTSTCGIYDHSSFDLTFTSVVFSYCTSQAVNIQSFFCDATFTGCQFSHCSSSKSGVGLNFYGYQLYLLESTFEFNFGEDEGSAFYSESSGRSVGIEWNFTDVSTTFCSGRADTMFVYSGSDFFGPFLNIARLNTTSNTIRSCGSAFYIHQPVILNTRYCFIKNNSRYNCISLSKVYFTHSIRCIAFHSNICSYFDGLQRGMFAVEGFWTIQDSIFLNNVVDYLVGDWTGHFGQLKFVRCSFDNSSFVEAMRGIERPTVSCSVGGYPLTLPRTCFTEISVARTRNRSISATEMPRETESDSAAFGIVIGSVAGGGLVVIIVVIVIGCFCYRKKRRMDRFESLESQNRVHESSPSGTLGQQQGNLGMGGKQVGVP
jgi:hypothetical protein